MRTDSCARPGCPNTFTTWVALKKFCSDECRELFYATDPDKKAKRSAYAKARWADPITRQIEQEKNRSNRKKYLSGVNRGKHYKIYAPVPPPPEKCENPYCDNKEVVFDHIHRSKQFRGWLCKQCNFALGQAHDNPQKLRDLADYLEQRGGATGVGLGEDQTQQSQPLAAFSSHATAPVVGGSDGG